MTDQKLPKLLLVDGHSLAFRAFYAFPPELATKAGEQTNAVFGFSSMLLSTLADEKPDYVAVAFDVGRTFRHDLFADYKGTRARTPNELEAQIPRIKEVLEALGIPILEVEGFEADDVLGTLARRAADKSMLTVLASGDSDLFQLVADKIHLRYTSGGPRPQTSVFDPEGVKERFQLAPRQLIDYKALVGDKSDNIPGVPGIGDKTARDLVQTYGSIEGIYDHLDEIKAARARNALAEHKDTAFLSKKLVTIHTDAPIDFDLQASRFGGYDQERAIRLFQELEFRSLVDRLPQGNDRIHTPALAPATPAMTATGQLALFSEAVEAVSQPEQTGVSTAEAEIPYLIVSDRASLQFVVDQLMGAESLAFDVETTDTDAMRAELVGVALAWAEGQAAYVPLKHADQDDNDTLAAGQLSWEEVRDAVQPICAGKMLKAAHNAKYDLTVSLRHNLEVAGPYFDTMIAEWLCDPDSRNLGLKNLALARLGVQMTEITSLIGRGRDQTTMDRVPIKLAAAYAAADVDITLRLVKILRAEMEEKGLTRLFEDVEMPLMPVLTAMEMAGVRLDTDLLAEMSAELAQRLAELEQAIYDQVGYAFNINSTQQLSDALFGKLALPTAGLRRTKSGYYSTAAGVLEGLRGHHPVIDLILEQRQLVKLKTTYVDALPQQINPETGRVHTSYNQTGAGTGRLSSSDPNLQNIPIRTEIGRKIRRAFVTDPGWLLLAADYSQVELRILAHVSGDPTLLEAFRRGEDIHASTAARVNGVPLEAVTPTMRRNAKAVNFGLMYGQGAYGLSQQTDMTQAQAAEFIENYFKTYPKVKEYLDGIRRQVGETGYVETLLGRRRYFPELKAGSRASFAQRQASERAAINTPIQGTAADIIKIAMVRLHHRLREGNFRARMVLQVHDELVLEAPEDEIERVAPVVSDAMENAFKLDASLKVDMQVGHNWHDMEPIII